MKTYRAGRGHQGRRPQRSRQDLRCPSRWSAARRLLIEPLEDRRLLSTIPLPTPLEAVEPLGGLIYRQTIQEEINWDDPEDRFTIELDARQTAAVVITPGAVLAPTVQLFGPYSTLLATAAAVAPGQPVMLQATAAILAGTYTLTISGQSNTTGVYAATMILNAAVEEESYDQTATNNSMGWAEDLGPSFIPLAGGLADRAAVLGGRIGIPAARLRRWWTTGIASPSTTVNRRRLHLLI